MPATAAAARLPTLDVARGAAVMGILLANVVAFGLPASAYFSPLAWGGADGVDRVAWFLNFVFVEGRMRGLFSLLFGASMLLVIEREDAAGGAGAALHLRRMAWLFALGCAHLYLLWWGDILAHYALVGAAALLFHRLGTRALVAAALAALLLAMVEAGSAAAPLWSDAARETSLAAAVRDSFAYAFGVPPAEHLQAEIAAMRGGWAQGIAWRWHHALDPLAFAWLGGAETLGAMLLGMAGWRSGFLAGAWAPAAYRRTAAFCLPVSLAGYAALGLNTIAHGFDPRWVQLAAFVASAPLRLVGTLGYAALLMLAAGRVGPLAARVGAAGRMALSNYLGTTLVMQGIFAGWGLGLFAALPRAALYLLVPPVWLLTLVWSPRWLARFRHGPFEWLWRSLVRGAPQPIRR